MPITSADLPTPPGEATIVTSPRTRSKPYNHSRGGTLVQSGSEPERTEPVTRGVTTAGTPAETFVRATVFWTGAAGETTDPACTARALLMSAPAPVRVGGEV